jgi:hypothetical protein
LKPPGEKELRKLADKYASAESVIRRNVAQAPSGARRELLAESLAGVSALRREEPRAAIVEAYLAAGGNDITQLRSYAGSLAKSLSDAVK